MLQSGTSSIGIRLIGIKYTYSRLEFKGAEVRLATFEAIGTNVLGTNV